MDQHWFKERQRQLGVTAEDIAAELGKDRSVVSRIYVGRQPMKYPEAEVFARLLDVPLATILTKAGLSSSAEVDATLSGSDATPIKLDDHPELTALKTAFDHGADTEIWHVERDSLLLLGIRSGDNILIKRQWDRPVQAGDIVLAEAYDSHLGRAVHVLREYRPPVLQAASVDQDDRKIYIVDDNNVTLVGYVVASWRGGPSPRHV